MNNLKKIRLDNNLSQSQLAKLSGVSVRMIQHYEQGCKDLNKASAITIYKLAKTLNAKFEDLLDLDEVAK